MTYFAERLSFPRSSEKVRYVFVSGEWREGGAVLPDSGHSVALWTRATVAAGSAKRHRMSITLGTSITHTEVICEELKAREGLFGRMVFFSRTVLFESLSCFPFVTEYFSVQPVQPLKTVCLK